MMGVGKMVFKIVVKRGESERLKNQSMAEKLSSILLFTRIVVMSPPQPSFFYFGRMC